MLKTLLIKNYALIQHLEITPSASLNIITGETGAGKSIMLGALGLLQGKRADTKVLYDAGTKCVIEGSFEITDYHLQDLFDELNLEYENVTLLRREIAPSGKSRAFVNDSPVRLEVLKVLSTHLIDIHSQHDTINLGENENQLEIVDKYAQNQPELDTCRHAFQEFRKAEAEYRNLVKQHEEYQREFDYNQHLYEELSKTDLEQLDVPALEKERELLENAEAIKSNLNECLEYLNKSEYAIEQHLKLTLQALGKVSEYSPALQELHQRLDSASIEIQDIAYEVEKEEETILFDQEKIETITDQLNQIYTLQQKHKVESVDELIALRESLREKVEKVLHFDEDLKRAKEYKEQRFAVFQEKAKILSATRIAVTGEIARQIISILIDLGIPNANFQITLSEGPPSELGTDLVEFLFSANRGIAPQELRSVASGGEFSRVMLAIKYILASKISLPTIIFDEIDTGVSGEIAIKLGKIMIEMAQKHQVISISHLPQVAARGNAHYFVYKDHSSHKTVSKIKKLSDEERIQAIAQMIGGDQPSQHAYQSAKELIMKE
ncbi:DNA repair protein RecN [Rapidithrix thailandica]|uniref:DNA repair protein RecN n=1 Tax=Rapidithrix thailandica TaxID=413964 RepID=A0AAW9SDJ1_9BACT